MPEGQPNRTKSASTLQSSNGDNERRLLEERREVIEEIFAQALSGNGSRTSLQDDDYAQLSQIRDLEYSRRESLNRRLRQLDEALGRIHSGLYGICSECGASIAEKRLAADPAVLLCIGCQAMNEAVVREFTL
ncbi:MAG TPA: TraR/DksA family transcriptional regulator [Blastocatellia bacterium]|nr:TraR/DksA family transcriptional regulator [Blastocatellia bacterium]